MKIAVLNQKGGAGKTTIAVNLARALQQRGRRVVVADADPQGSAVRWREASGRDDYPTVVGVDRDSFGSDVEAVLPAFDDVIIDGAPRMDARNATALRTADLVLIPVQPSAMDLWAAADLVAKVRERQELTGGQPAAAFVVSRAITGTTLAGEAADAFAQLGLPVLEAGTAQRIAYADAAGLGLSVLDFEPKGKAAEEIGALTDEILQLYDGTHHG